MIIPATWDELSRKYHEFVAAVWGCPTDELDDPEITHESTIDEVARQIKAEQRLRSLLARAHQAVCHLECPATWKTADGQTHCNLCREIEEALK